MKTSRNCCFPSGRGSCLRLLTVVFSVALASAALTVGAAEPGTIEFVDYIESSGTQYIDTGFSPSNTNIRIEATYRFVTLPPAGTRHYVFGSSYNTGNNKYVRLQYSVGEDCYIGFGNKAGNVSFNSYDTDTTHTIVCSNGVFSLDGQTLPNADLSSTTFTETTDAHPVYLFGHNVVNSATIYRSSIRLYSCKIWDKGVLVRDFRPALVGGAIPCLYDMVGERIYYNPGPGSFAIDGELAPTTYRKLSYIESDQTAYIDTRYVPNAQTEIEVDFAFTKKLGTKPYIFGTYGDEGGRFQFSYGPSNAGCFLGYGWTFQNNVSGIPYNTSRHIAGYVPGEGFYFDSNQVTTASVNLTTWKDPKDGSDNRLYLGALNPNGKATSFNQTLVAPIQIYSCKIWEAGVLIHDFVPKQRVPDGKNGLYDTVTKTFFGYYGTKADFTGVLAPFDGLMILIR